MGHTAGRHGRRKERGWYRAQCDNARPGTAPMPQKHRGTHAHTCTPTHPHQHQHPHPNTHPYPRTHTHTHMHPHPHNIYAHMHTYMHTHLYNTIHIMAVWKLIQRLHFSLDHFLYSEKLHMDKGVAFVLSDQMPSQPPTHESDQGSSTSRRLSVGSLISLWVPPNGSARR